MTIDTQTQTEHWLARRDRVTPGKQSNFRSPPDLPQIILESQHGLRHVDVDGREYIDFTLGMGPAIWGYSDEEYNNAIKAQIDTLLSAASGALSTRYEIELAERVVELVPAAEMVRFCISGTEADQLALRLARAYTKRPYFVRFNGHYHGWMDDVFGGLPNDDVSNKPFAIPSAGDSAGLSPHAFQESFKIRWNDIDLLKRVLEKYGDQICLLLMEGINTNGGCRFAVPEYLEEVRELCNHYGILLCFDEVITGFRTALGGAQELTGVTPDLAIYGKALAGGLPLAAVVGKADVMLQLRDGSVTGGGTFNAFPLGMAAGLATMDKLSRDDGAFYKTVMNIQTRFIDGLKSAAEKHGHDILIQGPCGVIYVDFSPLAAAYTDADMAQADSEKTRRFRKMLIENGVLMAGGNRFFFSSAHTDADIQEALAVVERIIAQL